MSRVEVIHADYRGYLKSQPDNAFDVVYFDPMFQHTNEKSKSMAAIKDFALGAPLEMDSIEEALRVCRKRVVVKERIGGGVFKKLGIRHRVGDIRFGAVVYGVIEKNSLKNQ
ncbi:Ribosomal RNA small subunit methyltransferase J like protein [Aduncisulcus paluster]|uniref:Ribosomal RNA small subunit methyltransferase J like protein n=1 Tax=Aduncisulcus paluster TaxID=2918883 RepID=A0ABQ5L1L3_9EUKA|nr:Ribosomal RNA small subunit methyltransferase J like protein [Aduncisulcus paluster]